MKTIINWYTLEPFLDVVEHVHRDSIDHGHLLRIVLEDEDHVEVLQVELNTLEVNQLDVLQRDDEWRPLREVHQRA